MGLFHKIAAAGLSLMMTVGLLTGCSGNTNQLDLPKKGEEIAVLKVKDYGEMKIRLFPKSAPKAVENFTTHAKNGYYDGLKFHRVIAEFMAQTGDPTGTGMGGESIWGEGFGVEHDKNLSHFTGALGCAQSSQPNSIGSQFYIVNTSPIETEYWDYMEQLAQFQGKEPYNYSASVKETYERIGGAPHLDGAYTVFGQVFEGIEVVEKIMAQETDESDMPKTDILIESITIVPYEG